MRLMQRLMAFKFHELGYAVVVAPEETLQRRDCMTTCGKYFGIFES